MSLVEKINEGSLNNGALFRTVQIFGSWSFWRYQQQQNRRHITNCSFCSFSLRSCFIFIAAAQRLRYNFNDNYRDTCGNVGSKGTNNLLPSCRQEIHPFDISLWQLTFMLFPTYKPILCLGGGGVSLSNPQYHRTCIHSNVIKYCNWLRFLLVYRLWSRCRGNGPSIKK